VKIWMIIRKEQICLKTIYFEFNSFLCESKMFANKYMALSVKFTSLSARPLFLRKKLCFCDFRSVKNITSNLRSIVIFFAE